MATVGLIGLGTMGRPMARNLLKAGHRLHVFARRPEAAAEAIAAGAVAEASPADVARAVDFVVTIVTADAQVEEVILGEGGVLQAAAAGKTLIEMSTIGPWTARKIAASLAQRGMAMLDAPVSGGPWGAESATLTIMAGGDPATFEKSRPVLSALGQRIFHLGPLGAGQTVKLVNQMVAGAIMVATAEGYLLAKAAGADLEKLTEVMEVSSGASAMLAARGRKYLLANQYAPGFSTALMHKDVRLAMEMALALQIPTPMAATARQQYLAALRQGHGAKDFAAVVKVMEQAAGLPLVP
jgi:2-hydroxy-3-oxopropionate reductase